MKLIHTADWHIGKNLHNIDLYEDFQAFASFLLKYVEEEKIDVVMVAGDIFDTSVPSNQARKQYFNVLTSLIKLGVKVIITAGNHDSIANIESPKQILEYLSVYAVGDLHAATPIVLGDVVIAPIPFFYDKDIRKIVAEQSELDRVEAVKKGIIDIYQQQSTLLKEQYPDKLHIALGHLFLQGVTESESERDIQIGKQAAVAVQSFENLFDYFALGHIHRPQKLTNNIRYSGSPIPLSFSERTDQKGFVQLTVVHKKIEQSFVAIPKVRDLIKVEGSFKDIQVKLQECICNNVSFPNLIDVEVVEEVDDPSLRLQINDWLSRFKSDHCIIANFKIKFLQSNLGLQHLLLAKETIEEMIPRNVFLQKIEEEVLDDDDKQEMLAAFDEILDKVLNS
ncbi:MAG TPA: exonuclease subunit SbcD [Saprospiraceae bacterium]|nr:exonuclease subunit SbcD [Saprospiraceae bacterium]